MLARPAIETRSRRAGAAAWRRRLNSLEVVAALGLLLLSRTVPIAVQTPLAVAIDVLMVVGLLWLNQMPRTGLALVSLAMALWFLPGQMVSVMALGPFLAIYIWVKNAYRGALIVTLVFLGAAFAVSGGQGLLTYVDFVGLPLLAAVAWVAGGTVRSLGQEARSAEQQRLESLRHLRMSVAAELHDTVAQSQTLVVMRAEDALTMPDVPEQVQQELRDIVLDAQKAIRSLRSTLAVLRDIDADFGDALALETPPLKDALADEEKSLRLAGFDPVFALEVDPDALDPDLRNTLTRIALELTSNIRWHGAPGPCSLTIREDAGNIVLVVTNRPAAGPSKEEGGFGLVAARERAHVAGGTLRVTQDRDTWTVRASLPRNPA